MLYININSTFMLKENLDDYEKISNKYKILT